MVATIAGPEWAIYRETREKKKKIASFVVCRSRRGLGWDSGIRQRSNPTRRDGTGAKVQHVRGLVLRF